MSEEKEGFFSQIKNQIITGVGVVITAAGGLVVSNMEALFTPKDDAAEVVIDQPETPNIIINIPEQKRDTVVKVIKEKVKPVPVKKTETEKRKEEGYDW
jgi:predicted sugar kinase